MASLFGSGPQESPGDVVNSEHPANTGIVDYALDALAGKYLFKVFPVINVVSRNDAARAPISMMPTQRKWSPGKKWPLSCVVEKLSGQDQSGLPRGCRS